jgi:hypothetical protein
MLRQPPNRSLPSWMQRRYGTLRKGIMRDIWMSTHIISASVLVEGQIGTVNKHIENASKRFEDALSFAKLAHEKKRAEEETKPQQQDEV